MKTARTNSAALVGGALLIAFGLLSLVGQIFRGVVNWSSWWPVSVIIFGGLFFAGMFAGGKQVAGLAIPGTIITGIGLLLLYQSLASHWESWAYAWSLIVVFVGLGIYLAGLYGGEEGQKRAGSRVMWIGFILFVLFGAFFEMIFAMSQPLGPRGLLFPVLMILLGVFLVLKRLGILAGRQSQADLPSDSGQPLPPAS